VLPPLWRFDGPIATLGLIGPYKIAKTFCLTLDGRVRPGHDVEGNYECDFMPRERPLGLGASAEASEGF